MKGRILWLTAAGLAAALFADAARAATRILPLGDSITHGDSSHNSYRRPLWQMLTNAGYDIDFVGSLTSNVGGPPPNPDFDLNHEGHSGYRADQLVTELPGWLGGYTPDIVLLHIGHNDVFQNQTTASTVNEIKQIIDLLRADNPNVVVLLAKIIPHTDANVNARINDLNAQVDGIAAVKSTAASPVLVVDQNSGYNAATDNYDGTHPNNSGDQKIANKWFTVLQTVIEPPVFYRAINVGGVPLTIDGRAWEGQSAPNYASVGTVGEYPSFDWTPVTDEARSNMLRSFVFANLVELNLSALPNGAFDVYVYTFEDNNPLTATLSVQGTEVSTYNSGPAGRWDRLGPFRAAVTNGQLRVAYQILGGDLGPLCGLELWRYPSPPSVELTSPAEGSSFFAPAVVALAANATDVDGSVTNVEFYAGSTKVGQDSTSPFEFVWNNVEEGNYALIAAATDNTGKQTRSAPVNVMVQASASGVPAPIVKLGFDENSGASTVNVGTAGGLLSLTATKPAWSANVPSGVGGASSLDFGATAGDFAVDSPSSISALGGLSRFTIAGWVNCRSATEGPGGNRIVTWINNGGDGVDLVYRADGSLAVGIDQWPDGTPARSSAAKIPADSGAAASNWRFFAVTYDSTVSTGQVKFYFGSNGADASLDVVRTYAGRGTVGSSIGQLTIGHFNPQTRPSTTPDRMFRGLIDNVQIFGSALNLSQITSVQRASAPPSVALSSPANGAMFSAPATITLRAGAADSDGTVNLVEFFQGNTKLGEDNASPYEFVWSSVPEGIYALTARATDNSGRASTSAVVNVTVSSTFYRAINVGGPPITIDGANWEGHATTNFAAVGNLGEYPSFSFTPVTDEARSNMLRTFVFSDNVDLALTGVPSGTYQVLVYTFEDNLPLTARLRIEGVQVTEYTSGPAGRWDRFGPFNVNVTDGTLNVRYEVVNDMAPICGLEVRRFELPPQAPAGLTAVAGNAQVILNWSAPPGAATYTIKRSTTSGGGYTTIASGVSSTSYTNTGLINDTTYYYVVSAVNSAGPSANSAEVSAYPNAGLTPVVRLAFNENGGTATTNSGLAGGLFALSTPTPAWSGNAPAGQGGVSALDFGTNGGDFAVDSPAVIDGLRGLGAFTISGWLNCRSAVEGGGGNRIVSWINNGGDGVDLVYHADGSLRIGIDQWPDFSFARSSSGRIPTDAAASAENWRFFAVTYDASLPGDHVKFYFGTTDTDAALDVARSYPGAGAVGLSIGRLSVGHFNPATRFAALDRIFRGLIDHVQIFRVALSPQDIVATQRGGGIAPPSVALTSPETGAAFTASAIIDLRATAFDTDGSVTLVEFFAGATKIGEDDASPYEFTWTGVPEGTYSLTARATDDSGRTSTSVPVTVQVQNPSTLYRAINVGGAATSINGEPWEGQTAPDYGWVGMLGEYPSFTFNPPVEAARSNMLRTFVFDHVVELTLSNVPPATYEVFVHTFEDNFVLVGDLFVQDALVTSYTSGPARRWDRLGPYRIVVTNGLIGVRYEIAGGDYGPVCGLEVRRVLFPPEPPVSLAAVAGSERVTLNWTASAGATSYNVKRSLVSGSGYTNIATGITATSFTDSTVSNGVAYYYVVAGVNSVGEGANSAEVAATPTVPRPLVKLGFNEASGTLTTNAGSLGDTLSLTTPKPAWTNNAPAYVGWSSALDFGTNSGNFVAESGAPWSGLGGLKAFTITGWINNRRAAEGAGGNRVVSWINNGGDGVDLVYHADGSLHLGIDQWPDTSPARSSAGKIPTSPAGSPDNWRFFAVSYDSAAAQVKFYFGAQGTNAALDVTRTYSAPGAVNTNIGRLSVGHFNVLTRPSALDRVIRGVIDEIQVFDMALVPAELALVQQGTDVPPPAPLGLAAQATNSQVGLSWTASPFALFYNLKRSTTAEDGFANIAVGLSGTNYLDTDVTNGVTYYYVLSAVNTAGEGTNSATASATPTAPPDAPTDLLATPADAQISLTWQASSNAASYTVKRSLSSGSGFVEIATGLTATNFTDTGLDNGVTYYYAVAAVNIGGPSSDSAEASAAPFPPPDAPANLVAVAGDAQATLTWVAASGADSYTIKRSTTSGADYVEVAAGLTSTAFTNTGLANGTIYFYVVSAINGSGESPNSADASATPIAPPQAPATLAAQAGDAQVVLNWPASVNAASYTLRRSLTSGSGYAPLATGLTSTTFTNTDLDNGTTYFYVVSAVNGSGESPNSPEASATPIAPPNAPTNLVAAPGNELVILSWAASSNAVSYTVKISTNSGTGYTNVVAELASTTFTNTSLSNGTTYFFVVSAVNGSGESPDSAEVSATPNPIPQPPEGLAAQPADARVVLNWSASLDAASYKVKRSTVSGGPYTTVATGATATSFTDTDVANGTAYYYVVSAANATGESADSTEASATPNPVPAAPAGLAAQPGNQKIVLTWTASLYATGYNVKRSTTGGGPYTTIAEGVSSTSFTNTDLVNGTAYFYVVSAANASGESTASAEASATPNPIPDAPAGLAAQAGDARVVLNWSASLSAASYKVKRSPTSGGPYTAIASDVLSTTFTNTGLLNGTTYYFVVSAGNPSGESADSAETSATPIAPPNAPTNLVAEPRDALVILSWAASSNAASYTLKVSTTSGAGYTNLATGLTSTTFTNTDLANGATYYFVVSAVNGSGESPNSAEASATPVAPPAAPAGLVATAGNAKVVLTWSASLNATRYHVKRSTSSGSGFTSVATNVTATTFTNTGLANGTTYFFVVSAANGSGESPDSAEAGATPIAPPLAPTGVQAVAGNGQVQVNWAAAASATTYAVKRSTTTGSGYTTLATGLTGTGLLDDTVVNGTTYYYVVSAFNTAGEGPNSAQAGATPVGPPAAPALVQAVPAGTRVHLSWSPSAWAASYKVKRSMTSGGPYALIAADLGGTDFVDTALVMGSTYFYVVSALNAAGESPDSAQVTATPTDLPAPIVKLAFNEGQGTQTTNAGTAGGLFSLTASVPQWTTNVPTAVGGASAVNFQTNAGNYAVDSPAVLPALRNLGAFTITGWLNNRSTVQGTGGNRVLSCINFGADGLDLVYRNDGSLQLGIDEWADKSPARSSAGTIPTDPAGGTDNWRFFAVTYNSNLTSGQVRFYFGSHSVEATLDVARTYASRGAVGAAIGRLTIGHLNPSSRSSSTDRIFRGLIDEVRVYGSALTAEEIIAVQRRQDAPAYSLPLEIARISVLQNGLVRLRIKGPPGATVQILASTTLTDWTLISTRVLGPDGVLEFDDPDSPQFPNRFYKAALP